MEISTATSPNQSQPRVLTRNGVPVLDFDIDEVKQALKKLLDGEVIEVRRPHEVIFQSSCSNTKKVLHLHVSANLLPVASQEQICMWISPKVPALEEFWGPNVKLPFAITATNQITEEKLQAHIGGTATTTDLDFRAKEIPNGFYLLSVE